MSSHIPREVIALAALRLQKLRLEDPWRKTARSAQLPPEGQWRTWFVQAGRGFGKTRLAAEWIREEIMYHGAKRVALVGATAADVRDIMIEGESGLLACFERYGIHPVYIESRRVIRFPNGARAFTYSAEDPARLRGPQHDAAWGDEIATWPRVETYENLDMGLRLGINPRMVLTSTPKFIPLVRQLVQQSKLPDADVVITRGTTKDNEENLSPSFMRTMRRRYEGTRIGRQELDGELLEDVEGALWSQTMIDSLRISALPDGVSLVRLAIGIDPSASSDGAETGIVAAGRGSDGEGYVLADHSLQGSPLAWARAAIYAYDRWRADRVVPEVNNGGEMVSTTLRTERGNLPIKPVHASRGKATRAEPISSLYEQGRVHHIGIFPKLEDQMTTWVPGNPSPDRMDALVWALTDVMLEPEEGDFETFDDDVADRLAVLGL